jgi:D-alanyl-D-alanine carboxypeptidase
VSIHPFVKDPNFLGGKTGHTPEAKDTMLTILMIKGQPIAIIVLSSDDRKADTDYLLAGVSAISDIAN